MNLTLPLNLTEHAKGWRKPEGADKIRAWVGGLQ